MRISITAVSYKNDLTNTCETSQCIDHAFDGEEKELVMWLLLAIQSYTEEGGINGMLDRMSKEINKKINKE